MTDELEQALTRYSNENYCPGCGGTSTTTAKHGRMGYVVCLMHPDAGELFKSKAAREAYYAGRETDLEKDRPDTEVA